MLTVGQVAERLGVSRSLVYALCAKGMISHERHGLGRGTIRVSEQCLLEYQERAKSGGRGTHSSPTAGTVAQPGLGFTHLNSGRLLEAWRRQG